MNPTLAQDCIRDVCVCLGLFVNNFSASNPVFLEVSVSEPHTIESNWGFSFIYVHYYMYIIYVHVTMFFGAACLGKTNGFVV